MSNYPLLKSFQRLYAKALDESGIFTTYEDLLAYVATNPTVYKGQPCIVGTEDGDDNDLYIVNGDKSLKCVTNTQEEITVYGDAIGMYQPNDVIPIRTNIFSILKNILQKIVPPIYVQPILTAIDNIPNNLEIGSFVTGTITPTFTQNNAGAIISYTVQYPNIALKTFSSVQPTTTTNADTANISSHSSDVIITAYYAQGTILNDNIGNPYPTGRIEAGSKTFNVAINVFRPYFYTADTGIIAPTTSSHLRAFTNSTTEASNGLTFSISIPAGTTRVCFTYRNIYQLVTSVKYVGLGNAEMKDLFTETSVVVTGLNGAPNATHRVYTYLPEAPFGDTATFIVTI